MKKIILILFIILNILPQAQAIEEEKLLENEKPVLLEIEKEPIYQEKEKFNPYTKEALKGIIEKEYDTKKPKGLFQEQLKAEFSKGPIESTQIHGHFIHTLSEKMDENDSTFKYNTQLINIGLKGKFRSKKEGYVTLFDIAPAHDNFFHKLVLDAWIETNRIKNNTLMFGTSRPFVGYEGGQSAQTTPFLARSQTARNFGNIRKTGVRLKGDYKYMDYDLGGYSSDTHYHEFMPGVETNLWVNFKPLANTSNKYGNLNIGGGINAGQRHSTDFYVASTALRYDYKKLYFLAEYANADGSNGASGLTNKKRQGYNLTLAYRLTKKAEILFRYDDFDNDKTISNNNSKEFTTGLNYFVFGQALRLIFNYIYCQNDSKPDSHKLIFGTQYIL